MLTDATLVGDGLTDVVGRIGALRGGERLVSRANVSIASTQKGLIVKQLRYRSDSDESNEGQDKGRT